MEVLWADLSRRLGGDQKLTDVMASLDRALDVTVEEEPRRRLKVPYANTTSLDQGTSWK
jgi:hypothetical protein